MAEVATEETKPGKWKACRFILGTECFERVAFYGISTNLVNYLQIRLNKGNVAASNSITNWSGTCYLAPLLGAFLADAYIGRYWTIGIFCIIYLCGLGLLTMTASVDGLNSSCNANGCHPLKSQGIICFLALYLIALGSGGNRPNISSFGADQFDASVEAERKKKSSFFNLFYLVKKVGALVGSSVVVWIQMNVAWGWGFGIPTAAMGFALVSFFLGTRLYRVQKPGSNPLPRLFQVVVASLRKCGVKVPIDRSLLYETEDTERQSCKIERSEELSFLDKAAVELESDYVNGSINPWSLCTVTQVEELKSIIRLFPVWASGIVFSAVYCQMSTTFILQGNTMDRHIGSKFKIPSASMFLFNTLSVIFWAPLYDRIVVRYARKFTGHERGFTQLQRMGIGLVVSILVTMAAGTLEVFRLQFVKKHHCYDMEFILMSILWQVPQYILVGCSEVFTFVGQLEFFYDQAPDSLKSLSTALSLTTVALGNYLSTLLVTVVGKLGWIPDNLNRGHLDLFYWLLSILSIVNLLVYLRIARWYTYKKFTE